MIRTFCIRSLLLCFSIALNIHADDGELRIVSLAPSNTAIVRDLGLSSALVGVTQFCERPKGATHAVVIGTITNPNVEYITALKPTLVLGNVESNRIESLDKIDSIQLPLMRLGPSQSLDEIIRDVKRVAEKTGKENAAGRIIAGVTAHLREIEQRISVFNKKRVFVEIWPKPLTTVSRYGFLHHVVEMAGGVNVFAEALTAYPQISMEAVLAKEPEAVFILTHSLVDEHRVKRYREFPQLKDAVITQTDAAEISQPSLSAFLNAVEFIVDVIHPQVEIPRFEWDALR